MLKPPAEVTSIPRLAAGGCESVRRRRLAVPVIQRDAQVSYLKTLRHGPRRYRSALARERGRPHDARAGQMSKRDRKRSMPTVTLLTWVYSRIASNPCSRPMPLIL